jgi:cytoskeleton protein RodZ
VGFVRTYADHLGLDSENLVQQFKEEAAGLQSRADLHFPAPLPEGKIPSGAVLVMAVVLAAVVYGAWIYLSSRDEQVAEMVPELPNRISEIIKGDPNAQGGGAPSGAVATGGEPTAGETPGQPAQPEASPIAEADSETAMQAATAEPASDEAAPEPAKAPEPLAAVEQADEAPQQTAETPPPAAEPEGDTATETPRTVEAIPQPPGSETGETDTASESATAPTPAEEIVDESTETASAEGLDETERAPPKVYGVENTGARIVIHAAADSWVEVRDSTTDELLLTRVLFKGDKYQVPDRGGLTLLTGNAGGLRIVVDGTDVPAIGPLGAVRRNVALEPSALLAGNATQPSGGGLVPADSQTSDSGFQSQ